MLCFLTLHNFLEPFIDDRLDLCHIVAGEGRVKLLITVLQPSPEMLVIREILLNFLHFLPTAHILCVVDHLVEQLLLGQLWLLRLGAGLVREE